MYEILSNTYFFAHKRNLFQCNAFFLNKLPYIRYVCKNNYLQYMTRRHYSSDQMCFYLGCICIAFPETDVCIYSLVSVGFLLFHLSCKVTFLKRIIQTLKISGKVFTASKFCVISSTLSRQSVLFSAGRNYHIANPRSSSKRCQHHDKSFSPSDIHSKNYFLKSKLYSTSLNIGLRHQRIYLKSQHVLEENNDASNTATFKYSKESFDPTTYDSYFYVFNYHPNFQR